jgi:predicted nucleotidyltransferase
MFDDGVLATMAERLVAVPGIAAVTLGGSRARGDHTPTSDVDLGLYYREPPDTSALCEYAAELDYDLSSVGRPGDWGPWVDGGAWLRVEDVAVDWIYRDVARVEQRVAAAVAGRTSRYPQVGHPFGFPAHAYAAEVALAKPLADPDGLLAELRTHLTPYPVALRQALMDDSGSLTSTWSPPARVWFVATASTLPRASPTPCWSQRMPCTGSPVGGPQTRRGWWRRPAACRTHRTASPHDVKRQCAACSRKAWAWRSTGPPR